MAGLAGMDELGRRAGGGERGSDLAADMTGLAHAADDDAALACQHEADGAGEVAVQGLGQAGQGGTGGGQHAAGHCQIGGSAFGRHGGEIGLGGRHASLCFICAFTCAASLSAQDYEGVKRNSCQFRAKRHQGQGGRVVGGNPRYGAPHFVAWAGASRGP